MGWGRGGEGGRGTGRGSPAANSQAAGRRKRELCVCVCGGEVEGAMGMVRWKRHDSQGRERGQAPGGVGPRQQGRLLTTTPASSPLPPHPHAAASPLPRLLRRPNLVLQQRLRVGLPLALLPLQRLRLQPPLHQPALCGSGAAAAAAAAAAFVRCGVCICQVSTPLRQQQGSLPACLPPRQQRLCQQRHPPSPRSSATQLKK